MSELIKEIEETAKKLEALKKKRTEERLKSEVEFFETIKGKWFLTSVKDNFLTIFRPILLEQHFYSELKGDRITIAKDNSITISEEYDYSSRHSMAFKQEQFTKQVSEELILNIKICSEEVNKIISIAFEKVNESL